MLKSLKPAILRCLPSFVVTRLKRLYYPRLVRNFDPARWPCSVSVQALIRPGDTVIDIGANIGYITGLFARWVGPIGQVHAFEPVPETFALLEHNVRAARWGHVAIYPLALSDASGHALMGIPAYGGGGGENLYESHLLDRNESGTEGERPVAVEKGTLDTCLPRIEGRLALIKIDVEGHEAAVVRGARKLLESHRPALVIEVNTDPDEPDSSASKMFGQLQSLGYSVYMPTADGVRPRPPGERGVDYLFLTPDQAELASVKSAKSVVKETSEPRRS